MGRVYESWVNLSVLGGPLSSKPFVSGARDVEVSLPLGRWATWRLRERSAQAADWLVTYALVTFRLLDALLQSWPWFKIQIVPPVNIPMPTKID